MDNPTSSDPTPRSLLRKKMRKLFSPHKLKFLRHQKIEVFLTALRRRQALERKLYEATH